MLQATEQQLSLVTRKVQRLEASLQAQIDALKSVRQQRNDSLAHVEALRAQLEEAESKAEKFSKDHDDAQAALKQTADEYSAAQLLGKKYQNAVQTLQGHCRSFVRLLGAERGSQPFVIADECTVNAVERKKSFVVDSVFDDSALDNAEVDAALNIGNMVADVLSGLNIGVLTFGPSRSGKSSFIFGQRATELLTGGGNRAMSAPPASEPPSVFQRFIQSLFDNLEANEVTHFNIRCSMAELTQEQLVDLLSEYGGVASVLGYHGGTIGGVQQSLVDLCSVQVQSAPDVMQLLQTGFFRAGQSRGRGNGAPPASHVFFTILIETFNTKGHFRRATATFTDLSGNITSGSSAAALPEHAWVNKSLACLCDVISMLSAANQQQIQNTGQPMSVPLTDIPHRHNRLIQLLKELLGGNCKTTMLCCVNTRVNTPEEILSALSYAFYFKLVKNFPVPYDIPPELQRLNLQMNRLNDDNN